MPEIEVAEIDRGKSSAGTVQKLVGKVEPRHRVAALREGAGQKAGTGRQVEHAELGRKRQPGQHVPVLRKQMPLDDGVQGRHPVEEAPRAPAFAEECFGVGHFSADSPAEPPEWDTDEGTTLFTRLCL